MSDQLSAEALRERRRNTANNGRVRTGEEKGYQEKRAARKQKKASKRARKGGGGGFSPILSPSGSNSPTGLPSSAPRQERRFDGDSETAYTKQEFIDYYVRAADWRDAWDRGRSERAWPPGRQSQSAPPPGGEGGRPAQAALAAAAAAAAASSSAAASTVVKAEHETEIVDLSVSSPESPACASVSSVHGETRPSDSPG